MGKQGHINVTFDFNNWDDTAYDLRIPVHQPLKQLLMNVSNTLKIDLKNNGKFAVKVTTKNLLLADDDLLMNFPITDGDVLVVL